MQRRQHILRWSGALLLGIVLAALMLLAESPAARAQSGNSWQGAYYNNPDWSGSPVALQTTNLVSFNWGFGSPAANVPVDNFTARFTTTAYFYPGTYRFTILADDEFVLSMDNVIYMDTRGRGLAGKSVVVDIGVNEGNRFVQVDFREFEQTAYIYVDWTYLKPSGPVAPPPTPPQRPLPYPMPPQSATSVQTIYGDYTPCIQNGQHQGNCFQSNGAWNAPNIGSIQLEPAITVWGNCEPPDSDVTWTTDPNTDPVTVRGFRCSKTLAGWFQR